MNEFIPSGWNIKKSIIKVIGVGGGGSNAVTQMYKRGIKDVEFMICNTDSQALANSEVPEKLQLGAILTKGLGAGCDPEQGRNAAIESIDAIKKRFNDNTQMVFITAGMGGGTGTGAAPIIAKVAKEMGLLTIGVVTEPFLDEMQESLKRAYEGTLELAKYVDSLLIIDNQKIYDIYGDLTIAEAFPKADEVLMTAVRGIAEIITLPGYINVDFADVKRVMKNSGMALMGIGEASGENRAREAVEKAFSSPLLNDYNLHTAKSALINIRSNNTGAHALKTAELSDIMEYIREFTGSASNFKRGVVFDPTMDEETISVTVVATGFKMEITPPPIVKKVRDNENLVDMVDDGDDNGILLTPPETSEDEPEIKLSNRDVKDIPIYQEGIIIADYENEPALVRMSRIAKEKEKENK